MKKTALMLLITLGAIVPLGALMMVDEAHAAPVDNDYRIWGTSTPDKGSLILAIDDDARVIFPAVRWSIWLSAPAEVTLTTPSGVLVDEILPAGLHDFTDVYEPGHISVVWQVGQDTINYNLMVATGAAAAAEIDDPADTITVEKWVLEQEYRDLAIGCIICALVPSMFLIPYYRRKKNDEFYLAF